MRVPSIYNFLHVKFKTGSADLRLRSQDGDCGRQGRVVSDWRGHEEAFWGPLVMFLSLRWVWVTWACSLCESLLSWRLNDLCAFLYYVIFQ